jgi:hypothetical protein
VVAAADKDAAKTRTLQELVAWRVEAQRKRLWQVQAICSITARAGREEDTGAPGFAQDVWIAMEAVDDLLDSIAGQLEAGMMLKPATPEEEKLA